MSFKLPYISEEEHEVNMLMLSLTDERINQVLRRIRKDKNIGEASNSIINNYKDWELRRLIIDVSVTKGYQNLNNIYYHIYAIHVRWWESEGYEVPF